MEQYGRAAVSARQLFLKGRLSPLEAWRHAVVRDEACPRVAYLGLCSAGLIRGIPQGRYGRGGKNAEYAIRAHSILRSDPKLAEDKIALWQKATAPKVIHHRGQMDIVLAL